MQGGLCTRGTRRDFRRAPSSSARTLFSNGHQRGGCCFQSRAVPRGVACLLPLLPIVYYATPQPRGSPHRSDVSEFGDGTRHSSVAIAKALHVLLSHRYRQRCGAARRVQARRLSNGLRHLVKCLDRGRIILCEQIHRCLIGYQSWRFSQLDLCGLYLSPRVNVCFRTLDMSLDSNSK